MKYLAALFLTATLLLVGCNNEKQVEKEAKADEAESKEPSTKEKQKIILSFINDEMKRATDYQDEALEAIDSVTSDKEPDEKMLLNKLVNVAIPAQEKSLEAAKAIEPEIEELEEPKTLLVALLNSYMGALKLRVESIEKQDENIRMKSDETHFTYLEQMKEFHSSMEELASDYNVTYEPRDMDLLSGIGTDEQKAILKFINEDIEEMVPYEEKVFQYMDTVTGDNYTDDGALHEVLVKDVIPNYEKVVEIIKDIKPGIEALEAPHELLVEATALYLEVFKLRAQAIEESDTEMAKQAEEKYSDYLDMIAEYQAAVEKVAAAYNVNYESGS